MTRRGDRPRVVILGGGMAGIGAACALARAGCDVSLVERAPELGGLAGSFHQDGAFYPIGYHHILATDQTLRDFLRLIDVHRSVRWRRVRVLFRFGKELHGLGTLREFLRFPLTIRSKAGLAALMARSFSRSDWTSWEGRSAAELVENWGTSELRDRLFEPLARLKFRRGLEDLSAAWLGARLHAREGASKLGYIPRANWTKVLCDGLTAHLRKAGCRLFLETTIEGAILRDERVAAVVPVGGPAIPADVVISTVPTPLHLQVFPADETPELRKIRYTALISAVCSTLQPVAPDFYWLNLTTLDRTACAIFNLSSLNPTIGRQGETCLNFVTHLENAIDPLFSLDETALMERYRADAREALGLDLRTRWVKVSRVKNYSPIFDRSYRNPPVRSSNIPNLYLAGNFRTYPAVASTGTALASGLEAAEALLVDLRTAGGASDSPSRRWQANAD